MPVSLPASCRSFTDILTFRAGESADKVAFSFLADGETVTETITFAELERRARALARQLVTIGQPRDRVLLIYQPGIDYIVAVTGCFYAGMIAVPAYPPHLNRPDSRLAAMVANCTPALTLTDERTHRRLSASDRANLPTLPQLTWLAANELIGANLEVVLPVIGGDDVALLQYTSGSTSEPKGVVLTHANLLANLEIIAARFGLHRDVVGLSWLPPYHDMGLIGFIFEPIYLGCHVVLMPPVAFVQSPIRWLRAIQNFQVCTTGAPNFGYEHCLKRIPLAERTTLDLRSWKRALNGAESVNAATLQRFAEGFAGAGFDAAALAPCYGLAEATLLVSGTQPPAGAVVRWFDAAALAAHEAQLTTDKTPGRAVELVSSGRVGLHTRVDVWEPGGTEIFPDGRVGEICVASPSVARGYWNLADGREGNFVRRDGVVFLRSGDLGFLLDGELYVTGRIKDLIILRGLNHYPQDLERTAGAAHPALQPGAAAAFAINGATEEHLVVAVEVMKGFQSAMRAEVIAAVNDAISARHQVVPHTVVLLRPGHLPKTSSGKVRRSACRQLFLDGGLTLAAGADAPPVALADSDGAARSRETADRLIAWLREYGATRINSRLIDERRTIPPYIVLDFGNQGLLGLQVAAEFGGHDLAHVDALRVMEQVAAIDLTLASFLGVHQALGTRPIKHFAPLALQRALLPAIASGRELAAFALTEPGAGSNPLALKTTAVPQSDGGWKLFGQKEWIGLGSWAGTITVFAQLLDAEQRSLGITAFAVRQGAPGLRQGPEALTLGVRGMVQNRIFFDGVPVTAAQMLGRPGEGMTVAQDAMMYGRLGLGVMSLAAMKRAAQLMLGYASARTVSTGRLLDNPVTLTRLHALTSAVFATEALVYRVAGLLDAGATVPPEVFMAVKVTAPELLGRTVDDLVQLVGGRAYIEPNLIPQLLRDARLIRIFEGPTETLTMALGAHLTRDAVTVLEFIEKQFHAPVVAERLRRLIETCKADGHAPHPWVVYQLGDIAAHALMLAAAETAGDPAEANPLRSQTQAWLERLLADKEAALSSRPFGMLAPGGADEIARRVADYATGIGEVRQTMAGEDQRMDDLLGGRPLAGEKIPTGFALGVASPVVLDAAADAAPVRAALLPYLAMLLEITPREIDPAKPLVHYGLDSLRLVELQFHVEKTHGYHISAEVFFDLLTLDGLVTRIAAVKSAPRATDAAVAVSAAPSVTTSVDNEPAPASRATDQHFF